MREVKSAFSIIKSECEASSCHNKGKKGRLSHEINLHRTCRVQKARAARAWPHGGGQVSGQCRCERTCRGPAKPQSLLHPEKGRGSRPTLGSRRASFQTQPVSPTSVLRELQPLGMSCSLLLAAESLLWPLRLVGGTH